jgi:hypothetical protein
MEHTLADLTAADGQIAKSELRIADQMRRIATLERRVLINFEMSLRLIVQYRGMLPPTALSAAGGT